MTLSIDIRSSVLSIELNRLKRTCVESASNKYVENLFKPLVAVQDRQDFDYQSIENLSIDIKYFLSIENLVY